MTRERKRMVRPHYKTKWDAADRALRDARAVIVALKRGSCWCDAGIDNPMGAP